MSKKLFVVTNPELGWDCIVGVFLAESSEAVNSHLLKERGFEEEPENWEDWMIIHESKAVEL